MATRPSVRVDQDLGSWSQFTPALEEAAMSDHSKVDPVVSGTPYRVIAVDGRRPTGTHELCHEGIVEITVQRAEQVATVRGSGREDGDQVVLYEKSDDGRAKDVRTWVVSADEDGLVAIENGAF
jgi:hypothetical protein